MTIQIGQTYRSADPRDSIRIRIKTYTPGENRALVVDASTGKRPRPMLVNALHASATTQAGKPRRSGYVLEQPNTGVRDAARQTTGQTDTDHYDARLNAPMTTEAAAELRSRTQSDTAAHRAVGQPAEAQPAEAEFTDASAAFMQIGQTPALQGLRVELRIEGYPPLVGNYAGAGMRRLEEGVLAIEPLLLFAWANTADGAES